MKKKIKNLTKKKKFKGKNFGNFNFDFKKIFSNIDMHVNIDLVRVSFMFTK